MTRYKLPAIGLLVLLGALASLAATHEGEAKTDSPLAGKAVIIEMNGNYFGVKENVRFETIGSLDFIVVPMQYKNVAEHYDHWLRLDRVTGLKVFDSLDDAVAYDKKTSPFRQREPESDTEKQ
ncbi:hypothetical protein [Blastopirellula marina]|uniref:Uncharacterized protein n=1 Tax=Blastopirellula marina TaxID=124 RepID=A0A2S8F7N9_9BACT|nr:hypothetical protein [Blastopirellula marina]PQO28150.1 hypothetical protein C5Y98_24920 [Blastopirellula marina]PTL41690.1 hypothetical protein C5Y97_24935 [Blastopirellula marina]